MGDQRHGDSPSLRDIQEDFPEEGISKSIPEGWLNVPAEKMQYVKIFTYLFWEWKTFGGADVYHPVRKSEKRGG